MASIVQHGRDLGPVAHVRISRAGRRVSFVMELSDAVARDLDTGRECTLLDDEGRALTLKVFKSFYSWGAFRAHGEVTGGYEQGG